MAIGMLERKRIEENCNAEAIVLKEFSGYLMLSYYPVIIIQTSFSLLSIVVTPLKTGLNMILEHRMVLQNLPVLMLFFPYLSATSC